MKWYMFNSHRLILILQYLTFSKLLPFICRNVMFYLLKTKIMNKPLVLSQNEAHHMYLELSFVQKKSHMNFLVTLMVFTY